MRRRKTPIGFTLNVKHKLRLGYYSLSPILVHAIKTIN